VEGVQRTVFPFLIILFLELTTISDVLQYIFLETAYVFEALCNISVDCAEHVIKIEVCTKDKQGTVCFFMKE
jgi:hypothetical protein